LQVGAQVDIHLDKLEQVAVEQVVCAAQLLQQVVAAH
jgi:hypothetical protein